MKKTWIVAAAALLVLSGCAAAPVVEEDSAETAEVNEPAQKEDLTIQAQPEPEPESPEAKFLDSLRMQTDRPTLMQATDAQLLEAGHKACEVLADDPTIDKIQLIDGEQQDDKGWYRDSMAIASNAITSFCPEIEVVLTPPAG